MNIFAWFIAVDACQYVLWFIKSSTGLSQETFNAPMLTNSNNRRLESYSGLSIILKKNNNKAYCEAMGIRGGRIKLWGTNLRRSLQFLKNHGKLYWAPNHDPVYKHATEERSRSNVRHISFM